MKSPILSKSGLVGLSLASVALMLAACGNSQEAAQAPAEETAEQVVARIAATQSPQDFKRREIECLETLASAKRAGENRLTPELAALVMVEPRMDFLGLVREARELGLEASDINAAQRSNLRGPDKPEDVTAEYTAHIKECLAISKVANARHGVTQ